MGKNINRLQYAVSNWFIQKYKLDAHLPMAIRKLTSLIEKELSAKKPDSFSYWKWIIQFYETSGHDFRYSRGRKPGSAVKKPAKAKKLATTHKLGFYWSDAWRDLRYRVLVKFGRKCMACGMMGSPAHVDHIKPRSKYPELELTFDNLQVLCEACNMGKRAWDETDWRLKG